MLRMRSRVWALGGEALGRDCSCWRIPDNALTHSPCSLSVKQQNVYSLSVVLTLITHAVGLCSIVSSGTVVTSTNVSRPIVAIFIFLVGSPLYVNVNNVAFKSRYLT